MRTIKLGKTNSLNYFRLLPFALVLSLLFSSCAPATQPPEPTTTLTGTPNPTATATITLTPTPTIPDIVLQMQAVETPGVTVDADSVSIQTPDGKVIADIPLKEADKRIVVEGGVAYVKDTSGESNIAVFDPSIKTERWGEGKRWIERGEGVKLDMSYNWDKEFVYNPNFYVRVKSKEELREAMHLGRLFVPPFAAGTKGIDPSETNPDYYNTAYNTQGIWDPIGYRTGALTFIVFNNIMFEEGDGHFSCVLQMAVLNHDGTEGVISAGSSGKGPREAVWDGGILGMRVGGNGVFDEKLDFFMPRPPATYDWGRVQRDSFSDNGLSVDVVVSALKEWLKTGNLPTTINEVPTEQIIFFGEFVGMSKVQN